MLRFGDREVGPDSPVYVIAEIGSNHNGSLETAKQMIDACAAAGVDAVKFQAFTREQLFIADLPEDESTPQRERDQELLRRRWEVLPQFTVPDDWWPDLARTASTAGVAFSCTPFSLEAVDTIAGLGPPFLKIASGDLTWHELIVAAGRTGLPLVLSTGASDLAEVDAAVGAAREAGVEELALLHCVSSYPPAWQESELRAIETMRDRFDAAIGLSDHSPGSTLPVAATALGACIVEKHVTFDRSQEGLDHHFALEPDELSQLVTDLRHAHEALGDGRKFWAPSEEIERFWVRRGIYLDVPVAAGTVLTRSMLRVVRPRVGLPADAVGLVIGRELTHDMEAGEPLGEEDLR